MAGPAAPPPVAAHAAGRPPSLESTIGRVLTVGTLGSVGLIAVGVALMTIGGISPLAAAPAFEPGRILTDVVTLQPGGWLWLGLVMVLATPAARVAASLVGYWRAGERTMAAVSAMILGVIVLGVLTGLAAG